MLNVCRHRAPATTSSLPGIMCTSTQTCHSVQEHPRELQSCGGQAHRRQHSTPHRQPHNATDPKQTYICEVDDLQGRGVGVWPVKGGLSKLPDPSTGAASAAASVPKPPTQ